jgi:hypothetical protein
LRYKGGFDLLATALPPTLPQHEPPSWWSSLANGTLAIDVKTHPKPTADQFREWIKTASNVVHAARQGAHNTLGLTTTIVYLICGWDAKKKRAMPPWFIVLDAEPLLTWRDNGHPAAALPPLQFWGGEVPAFPLTWLGLIPRTSHPIWEKLAQRGAAGPEPGEDGHDGHHWVTIADAAGLLMSDVTASKRGSTLKADLEDDGCPVERKKPRKSGAGVRALQDACHIGDLPPRFPSYFHDGQPFQPF